MEEIKIDDIGRVSVNSKPKHDKDEDEWHTVETISFVAMDTELEKIDQIRAAGNAGKVVSITFVVGD